MIYIYRLWLLALRAGQFHSSLSVTVQNYDVVRPRIVYDDGFRPYPKLLTVEIVKKEFSFTLKLKMNE